MTAAILAIMLGRPPTSESPLLVIIMSISTARPTNYSEKQAKHPTDPVCSTEAVARREGFKFHDLPDVNVEGGRRDCQPDCQSKKKNLKWWDFDPPRVSKKEP
jgi:hypothetical protein